MVVSNLKVIPIMAPLRVHSFDAVKTAKFGSCPVVMMSRGRIRRPRRLIKLLSRFYDATAQRAAKLVNLARRVGDEPESVEARVLIRYYLCHRNETAGRHHVGVAFMLLNPTD